ncbi:coiled-coil domain-containing protein 89 isoform X2 [Engraulis encrasicolus]|uniref:coiled-coil domain-containing protein 89 isoform X2 n=1 Tax=Engraulis encrasicolus TaxID=184585 RepID=UPI002FD3D1D7
MASPQKNPKDLKTMIADTKQDMDDVYKALEKLRSLSHEERAETGMLRSRIDEQSNLICILKQRADDMLLRCQALDKINTELESLRDAVQIELDNEKKRSSQLEQRFMDLASNHQELIKFKDEYKRHNAALQVENERLREENKTLFCKELQEKETVILQLTEELRDLAQEHVTLEAEYHKLRELMNQHQTNEASLQHELQDTQEQLKNAVDMCAELDLRLKLSQDRDNKLDAEVQEKLNALTKEKEELLDLSMQRGKIILEKQAELQELENKRLQADNARMAAEDRFEKEASAVNADLKVKELQHALDVAEKACDSIKKDFEAYKKHSYNLLAKEKELNARLRHVTG